MTNIARHLGQTFSLKRLGERLWHMARTADNMLHQDTAPTRAVSLKWPMSKRISGSASAASYLRHALLRGFAVLVALAASPAWAQIEEQGPRSDGPTTSTLRNALPDGGDPAGMVKRLSERGIEFRLSYIADALGNVRGGQRRGWIGQGLFEPSLRVDFDRLAGIHGLRAYANGFFIHNTGRIRRDYVGGVNTIAAIEAMPRIRLSELWLEQSIANGLVRLRAGQLAADVEFFFSDLSPMFLQSDFPTISALNLPGGGPAFPLATPGVMVQVVPNDQLNFRAALFNGRVSRTGEDDDQVRNRYNTDFRVRDPGLFFAEARFRQNQAASENGLARTVRLGGWAHLGRFDNQRRAADGSLLADPSGSGVPLRRRGTGGLYAVLDQQLWRPAGGDALSGISLFGRISVAPSDRSTIGFYFDGGMVFANLVPGRPHDRFGFSVIHARYSAGVRRFDQDLLRLDPDASTGRRTSETNLELTYLAEIAPGFDLQPIVTHIWNPSERPGRNALVVGLRTRILY
ncbi:carbohydrate porin [Belnapia sp. T18]|uniref:Carbohydrate porin n=1 Tax=Belnapia arida TaxID=2804533 RepID=A0ABS1UFU5_9PROT|nr:carbohydrate porin [Belnapia arida]MBL6082567.1 carbohydrate porin [Belnapia arida]